MIDIKAEASAIDRRTAERAATSAARGRPLTLIDVIATDDEAVWSYARTKEKKADKLGILYRNRRVAPQSSDGDVCREIEEMNRDPSVNGVMLSTPIYGHLGVDAILDRIDRRKDVDGLSPLNVASLANNCEADAILPATAMAAVHLLEKLIRIEGRHVVILGRGKTVGHPVARMLLNRGATITVCHSRSVGIRDLTRSADVVITAVGKAGMVDPSYLKPRQIVIDCGVSFQDGRICGDVDPSASRLDLEYLSPVPGGVGLLTNSYLFSNLAKAAALQEG